MDKLTQRSIHLRYLQLQQILLSQKIFYRTRNRSQLLPVRSLQPRHRLLQPANVTQHGATSAGPTLNSLLTLELHESSANIHNVGRLYL